MTTTTRARDQLNAAARQELRWAGITAPGWARWCGWEDGQWHGDRCGCHHDPYEQCGCLEALLAQRARGAAHQGDYGPDAYYLTGRRP